VAYICCRIAEGIAIVVAIIAATSSSPPINPTAALAIDAITYRNRYSLSSIIWVVKYGRGRP